MNFISKYIFKTNNVTQIKLSFVGEKGRYSNLSEGLTTKRDFPDSRGTKAGHFLKYTFNSGGSGGGLSGGNCYLNGSLESQVEGTQTRSTSGIGYDN